MADLSLLTLTPQQQIDLIDTFIMLKMEILYVPWVPPLPEALMEVDALSLEQVTLILLRSVQALAETTIQDAPSDGLQYGRQDGAWTVIVPGVGGGIPEAPTDGKQYGRQNATWTEIIPGGGGGVSGLVPWQVAYGALDGTIAQSPYLALESEGDTPNVYYGALRVGDPIDPTFRINPWVGISVNAGPAGHDSPPDRPDLWSLWIQTNVQPGMAGPPAQDLFMFFVHRPGALEMTEVFAVDEDGLDLNDNFIHWLADPVAAEDGANKRYVDTRAVPAGGAAGQVLTKTAATDYATAWQTPAGGGGGVSGLTPAQVLFGKADGTIAQDSAFAYSSAILSTPSIQTGTGALSIKVGSAVCGFDSSNTGILRAVVNGQGIMIWQFAPFGISVAADMSMMGLHRITDVPDPMNSQDAATKFYVDTRAVPVGGAAGQVLTKTTATDYAVGWTTPAAGGGGVSGLAANQVLFGKADGTIAQDTGFSYASSTKQLTVGSLILGDAIGMGGFYPGFFFTPTDGFYYSTAGTPPDPKVYLTFGSVFPMMWKSTEVNVNVPMKMGSHPIQNLSTPVNGSDAATKNYVDTRAVPAGGAAGQVLTKTTATDYATAWQTPAAGGGGVSGLAATQVLFGKADGTIAQDAGFTFTDGVGPELVLGAGSYPGFETHISGGTFQVNAGVGTGAVVDSTKSVLNFGLDNVDGQFVFAKSEPPHTTPITWQTVATLTMAGNLSVRGPVRYLASAARYYRAAAQMVPNNANTIIWLDTVEYATGGVYAGGSAEVFVPIGGVYLVILDTAWTSSCSNFYVHLHRNNSGTAARSWQYGGIYAPPSIALLSLAAGESVQLRLQNASGTDNNLVTGRTALTVFYVGSLSSPVVERRAVA